MTRTFATYLSEHPKLMGVLFTTLLLVSQSGTALAGSVRVVNGP